MRQRKFTFEEQIAFAKLSGDYNPLHTDKVAARRLIFGRPVVHGIHLVVWALDHWLEGQTTTAELRSIKADFLRPVGLEEEVTFEIKLLAGGSVAAKIKLDWAPSKRKESARLSKDCPERRDCRALSAEEVETASGSLDLCLDLDAAAGLFRYLPKLLSPLQIAEMLATTRLVGVECPGFHSVYGKLNLTFVTASDEPPVLRYEVTTCDKRFGLVVMKVSAPGMTGTVGAFLRPTPQEQASFMSLREQVSSTEFTGQRALVIGGSRGLGEITAKLLSAGGAEVQITYSQGAEDARRVVDEVTSGGGSADCFHFDVLNPKQDLPDRFGARWAPTHLYYFATPFIASAVKGSFSFQLFQRFCNYYVAGFLNAVRELSPLGLRGIFYPSSVFVDELPSNMGEYAAAKAAGETLCSFLEKSAQDITICKPRLPKMATDQTVSLLFGDSQDPVPIMLGHLRHLRDSA